MIRVPQRQVFPVDAPDLAQKTLVNAALEDDAPHLEKGLAGNQGIRAGLVARTDALDAKAIGQLVDARATAGLHGRESGIARRSAHHIGVSGELLHYVLDVVKVGKELVDEQAIGRLVTRQRLAEHNLEQIAKVVAGVVGDPADILRQDQARGNESSAKLQRVNTILLKQIKVNACLLQDLDRVVSKHVVVERKLKVELPGARVRGERIGISGSIQGQRIQRMWRRDVPVRVEQRNAQLDDLEKIDIAAQSLIMI